MTSSFLIDGSYRRYDRVVIAGSPLRLFRLTAGGQRVVEAIEQRQPLPSGHTKLTDPFVDAGAIHPSPTESSFTTADVTIVVPAFNAQPSASRHDGDMIVVDDASDPPLPAIPGCTAIRLPINRGPGAARNAGLTEVTTPLVAFVDTDVDLDDGWLEPLLAHFNDPQVALVAPRVRSSAGASTLAKYETARSPLDLGDQAARIAAGTRVSYVPAAAIVVRTDALRAIGGFDEALRTGEDVDMVWRLIGAGYRCRYEPAASVHHHPRSTLWDWVRQRLAYGRSAAALDRKHQGAVAPLRMSGWSAAVWALVLARRPGAAAVVATGTIVALRRKLDDVPAQESIRLAGLGHLYAGRQVASAITRVWWPVALVAALLVPRLRLPLLGASTVPALLDWLEDRGPNTAAQYIALRLADDVAYGTGAWIGAIEQRSVGALAPKFTSWPGRTRG
ncbi:MAG: mycofactocin biosynthesis glycosyltransferase MftF [Ilumatobacteraceae bacterium]|nr:mycofactocin biosynthesis glycosyltransferase MftF [Ilumatobacteraceae bacterium]